MVRLQLLVSVRMPEEVAAAIDGGADWIDLKEPRNGALGAVDVDVAREIIGAVAGRSPISAALGEYCDWHDVGPGSLFDIPGIEVVKLGMHRAGSDARWRQRWMELAHAAQLRGKHLAAVTYADWQNASAPSPTEMLEVATNFGSRYLLVDTFDKAQGSLLERITLQQLVDLLLSAKNAGLSTLVAGSLTVSDLGRLPLELIDRLGVRGAVCRDGRKGRLDGELVRQFSIGLGARECSVAESV